MSSTVDQLIEALKAKLKRQTEAAERTAHQLEELTKLNNKAPTK